MFFQFPGAFPDVLVMLVILQSNRPPAQLQRMKNTNLSIHSLTDNITNIGDIGVWCDNNCLCYNMCACMCLCVYPRNARLQ